MKREHFYRFWLTGINKMTHEVALEDVGKIRLHGATGYIPLQYSGHKDREGRRIFEGDIWRYFESSSAYTALTGQDEVARYRIMTWIGEWTMFAWLELSEYLNYREEGAESLNTELFWTYPVGSEDANEVFVCGNIYENKGILEHSELP